MTYADLETWSKRVGAIAAVLGGLIAAFRFGRAVWVRVRYYWALYSALVETHEALRQGGGAKAIVETLTRLPPMLEELSHRLLLNEARWRASHDDDPRGMFEADARGRWVWANGTLLELVDVRDVDDVNGLGWIMCFGESWRDRVRAAWEHAVAEETSFEMGAEVTTHNGRALVKVAACILRDKTGKPMGWSGTVTQVAQTAGSR